MENAQDTWQSGPTAVVPPSMVDTCGTGVLVNVPPRKYPSASDNPTPDISISVHTTWREPPTVVKVHDVSPAATLRWSNTYASALLTVPPVPRWDAQLPAPPVGLFRPTLAVPSPSMAASRITIDPAVVPADRDTVPVVDSKEPECC